MPILKGGKPIFSRIDVFFKHFPTNLLRKKEISTPVAKLERLLTKSWNAYYQIAIAITTENFSVTFAFKVL